MDLNKPYENNYFLNSILKGLKFYYEIQDKVNSQIYLEKDFFLKRKDIQLAIDFLSSIPKDSQLNYIAFSHPQLTLAMESIERLNTLSTVDLSFYELRIISFLDHFLFTACTIMVIHMKSSLSKTLQKLSVDDKIKHLIESKYYYTQNDSAFPSRFINEAVQHCVSLIEKYKELRSVDDNNIIDEEIKRIVENYVSVFDSTIKRNDLISPLIQNNFEEFILKIKEMLLVPSFFDIYEKDTERIYHIYLLGVLKGKVDGYELTSNKEVGLGRYDITLTPVQKSNPGVIIEIKKLRANSEVDIELESALQQIEIKLYNRELVNLGVKTILYIAIGFQGKSSFIKFRTHNN